MKRFFIPILLAGAMLAGCSEEKGGQNPEEPTPPATENPAEFEKTYADVAQLPVLNNWTPSASEKNDLEALADFTFKLNKAFCENRRILWDDEKDNYSFSPVSISVFMAVLSQSVNGEAREDLCKMMGMSEEQLANLSNKLVRYLQKNEEICQISLANSVWLSQIVPVLDSYKERMSTLFGAPVNSLPNLCTSEAMDIMNSWGSDKTHGMIEKMFVDPPKADVVIANALYFSSSWEKAFDEKATTEATFHGTKGANTVSMMHETIIERYVKADGAELIRLPFAYDYEMLVVLPDENSDIDALSASLNDKFLAQLYANTVVKRVELSLPRFKDERRANIKDILKIFGYPDYDMPTLEMTGSADFPLLENNSRVDHITALNVNEKGAELAAITVGSWASSPGPGEEAEYQNVKMTVDRPFYYIIRNTTTGAIMMIGRINNL